MSTWSHFSQSALLPRLCAHKVALKRPPKLDGNLAGFHKSVATHAVEFEAPIYSLAQRKG
jgi:hypothetical protein